MSTRDEQLDKIIELLEFMKPYIEWTHNYSIAQVRLLKQAHLEIRDVIKFYHNGTVPISFYVPKGAIDHIQTYQLMNESFWDLETLETLRPVIDGKHVLDVGANVGNHTVFWGCVAGAASIRAFEPIPETYAILERNVSLNNLSGIVETHRCALGAEDTTGDPTSRWDNMMQATVQSRSDARGSIRIRTLDSFMLRDAHFAKIDVEGHTRPMLEGSLDTLHRLKPVLYVELFPEERGACRDIVERLGYETLGSIEEHNYVFIHPDRNEGADQLRTMIKGAWPAP